MVIGECRAVSRRGVLGQCLAAMALVGVPAVARAQDRYDQQHLLDFAPVGAVTLMHIGDLFGQQYPHFMRPSAQKLARSGERHLPEHLTGELLRIRFGVGGRQPMDYALNPAHFEEDAAAYGPMGGLAHLKTVVDAIRTRRPGAVLIAGDGADALSPLDMSQPIEVIRVKDVPVAVIGLGDVAALGNQVAQARAQGAVVVCRSAFGVQANRQIAVEVPGIDLILCSADAPAFPDVLRVQDSYLVSSGTQGRFVSRIDLDVQDGQLTGVAHRLIPVFSDLIDPTPVPDAMIMDKDFFAVAAGLLYRRGTLGSTWDDLICAALRQATGAQIALVPGLQHGVSVLPGMAITRSAVESVLWGRPPEVRRARLTGAEVDGLLQDAAEAVFHLDPLQRSATAMMRAQGVTFALDSDGDAAGKVNTVVLEDGGPLDLQESYDVALWGLGPVGVADAPAVDMIARYLKGNSAAKPDLMPLDRG